MNSPPSPAAYAAADDFIRRLRQYRGRLSREQLKTLRGLALKGDIDGAVKGLGKILKREDLHMVRPLTLEAALDVIEKERPIVIESRRFGIIANWFTAFDKDGFLIWLRVATSGDTLRANMAALGARGIRMSRGSR